MKRIFQPGSDLLDKSDKTETHPKKKWLVRIGLSREMRKPKQ